MKIPYSKVDDNTFLDPTASAWERVPMTEIGMYATPLALTQDLSPFMALSTDHGKIDKLRVRAATNGKTISIQLSWSDGSENAAIRDLDDFVDAAAVLFPLTAEANAVTMGDADNPVNSWFWKADQPGPFDVIAHGFGSSRRRSAEDSGLQTVARHRDGRWHVVFQRPLRGKLLSSEHVKFVPGSPSTEVKMSFAVWDGGNAERAGQKSFSGGWQTFEMEV
jgi:DMSO reductase family type II enzyme heme b subunit